MNTEYMEAQNVAKSVRRTFFDYTHMTWSDPLRQCFAQFVRIPKISLYERNF